MLVAPHDDDLADNIFSNINKQSTFGKIYFTKK